MQMAKWELPWNMFKFQHRIYVGRCPKFGKKKSQQNLWTKFPGDPIPKRTSFNLGKVDGYQDDPLGCGAYERSWVLINDGLNYPAKHSMKQSLMGDPT